MKKVFISLIKAYQFLVSPLLGGNCRFHPTCSAYTVEAIEKHGIGKGFFLALKRITRCHPWSSAGFEDKVPKRFAWRDLMVYKKPNSTK
ncbi:MAG: membrane protein insertion efficiency factor YidD [Micavibrio sp.]|nr:membrane protein insertion efficiency factor YidD [Micavibrio sp.]|tara:strand:+ start:709 stop:975 length:267 start_codon:yes stop_codon:yes gene_type:complete